MDKLQELREAHFEKQRKEALMVKIAKQLDDINRLRQDQEVLQYKLQALKNGCPSTDLYPNCACADTEFLSLHETFANLKQKLSMCRLLGPCGLTVLDVQSKSLVVSFTSVWKTLTQTFLLHIADDKDTVKVASTTIPYFIDVDSMISGPQSSDWSKIMEDLGYLLNAYTQRRREVESVQVDHKSILKQMSHNEPITAVEMELALLRSTDDCNKTNVNNSSSKDHPSIILQVKLHLIYSTIQNIYPDKVSIASSHFISKEERSEIRNVMKSTPLSQAFPLVLERLNKVPVDPDDEVAVEDV